MITGEEWDDCVSQGRKTVGAQESRRLPDPFSSPQQAGQQPKEYGAQCTLPKTPNPNPGNDLSPASLGRHRACFFASAILTDSVIHAYSRPTELFFATYMNPSYWPGTWPNRHQTTHGGECCAGQAGAATKQRSSTGSIMSSTRPAKQPSLALTNSSQRVTARLSRNTARK